MRISSTAIAAVAGVVLVAACGSSPSDSSAAPGRAGCDAYAKPGAGTAQALLNTLKPGQTGCLHGGRYTGTGPQGYVVVPQRGGRPGRPITLRSAPGERAQLRGIVYVPPGANRFTLSHVDLDARHPQRPAESQIGVQVLGDRAKIAASRITTHANQTCLIIQDAARRTTISGSVFYDCGDPRNGILDHAIYAANSRRARITGNVFTRTSAWAVHLYPGARNSYVARNLMWDNGGAVIFGGDENLASSHNVVVDNVMGASHLRPELTSSFGGPVGRGNVARDNCLAPGLLASNGEGFSLSGNKVEDGDRCLDEAGATLVNRLRSVGGP